MYNPIDHDFIVIVSNIILIMAFPFLLFLELEQRKFRDDEEFNTIALMLYKVILACIYIVHIVYYLFGKD